MLLGYVTLFNEYEIFVDVICFSHQRINHTHFPIRRSWVSTLALQGVAFNGKSSLVNPLTWSRFSNVPSNLPAQAVSNLPRHNDGKAATWLHAVGVLSLCSLGPRFRLQFYLLPGKASPVLFRQLCLHYYFGDFPVYSEKK